MRTERDTHSHATPDTGLPEGRKRTRTSGGRATGIILEIQTSYHTSSLLKTGPPKCASQSLIAGRPDVPQPPYPRKREGSDPQSDGVSRILGLPNLDMAHDRGSPLIAHHEVRTLLPGPGVAAATLKTARNRSRSPSLHAAQNRHQ